MTMGDVVVLDDAYVEFNGTDISQAVARTRIMIAHEIVIVPQRLGQTASEPEISANYSWELQLHIVSSGYHAGELDHVITGAMRPPLGPFDGDGVASIVVRPFSSPADVNNPQYSGNVLIHEWEPLGGGDAAALIRQTRVFPGHGKLFRTPRR